MAACPLCGAEISWSERQVGKYMCLYVCVRVASAPRHFLEKHPEYVSEASGLAKPIFYFAVGILFSTGVLLSTSTLNFQDLSLTILVAAQVVALVVGAWVRIHLLNKFKVIGPREV